MAKQSEQVIRLKLKQNSYKIAISTKEAASFLRKSVKALAKEAPLIVVTNKKIQHLYAGLIRKAFCRGGRGTVLTVPDSESAKSPTNFLRLINQLIVRGRMARPVLVAFGGGVVGDLAGFAASVYRRGIPYIQIPTTLLAQVDSSIGGKTAIDSASAKNIIGSIYQPMAVFAPTGLLKTLPRRQFANGMAEVIKYGLIKDAAFFRYIQKNHTRIMGAEDDHLLRIVSHSARIKARIVERDEHDRHDVRALLNFGHTIGHAIESACRYKIYTHGEAVALGSLCAVAISAEMGYIKAAFRDELAGLYKAVGLKTKIKNVSTAAILKALQYDKKFVSGKNKFVLLAGIGRAFVREGIPPRIIHKAIKEGMGR